MATYNAVQFTDTAANQTDAESVAAFLADQVDYIGGRVLAPSDVYPTWRVQALFEDCGHDMPLPDGCRRVFAPSGFLSVMRAP